MFWSAVLILNLDGMIINLINSKYN